MQFLDLQRHEVPCQMKTIGESFISIGMKTGMMRHMYDKSLGRAKLSAQFDSIIYRLMGGMRLKPQSVDNQQP